MEISEIKREINTSQKKVGGRPLSEGWALYNFTRLETRGAQCGKCSAVIKNTSNSRMVAHYKRCSMGLPRMGGIGTGGPGRAGKDIQSIIQSKIEFDDSDDGGGLDPATVLWTSQHPDGFEDESADPINHAMDILNGDIQRHRKIVVKKRPRPTEASSSQSIDAAISSFLIGCNLTFDIIDSNHFKNFVRFMNPSLPIPSSSQLKSRVLTQLQTMQNNSVAIKKRRPDTSDSD